MNHAGNWHLLHGRSNLPTHESKLPISSPSTSAQPEIAMHSMAWTDLCSLRLSVLTVPPTADRFWNWTRDKSVQLTAMRELWRGCRVTRPFQAHAVNGGLSRVATPTPGGGNLVTRSLTARSLPRLPRTLPAGSHATPTAMYFVARKTTSRLPVSSSSTESNATLCLMTQAHGFVQPGVMAHSRKEILDVVVPNCSDTDIPDGCLDDRPLHLERRSQ